MKLGSSIRHNLGMLLSSIYLNIFLAQFGAIKSHVTHPIVTLDFQPLESAPRRNLGLLSDILATPCRIYLYDRPVQTADIVVETIPSPQWILCPSVSDPDPKNTGLYHLGSSIVLVAINQLARSRDTIWLRLLGDPAQQVEAIDDLLRLPTNHPHRRRTIGCLAMIQINRPDDDRLPMLTPVYEKWQQETQAVGYTEGHTAGEAHGRQLEREALTLKLLQEKIAPAIVARVTGYSLKQVEAVRSALAKT
jgi:hypothetical protein